MIHSFTTYKRLQTKEVKVGDIYIGNHHPIVLQTMTTTDTLDTDGTVAQVIRCANAGAQMVRITAPSKKEAENLLIIKNKLREQKCFVPLVADIHYTPNAAEIAARIVEKVRINPGNYIDKKKFELKEYTDEAYNEEISKIYDKFLPLINICKQYGTALRIGTNHGSLSDRIMSRYGDTAIGMVESAMEFLRILKQENFHQVVLSMKSSNPIVMVQAYRLLVKTMQEELGYAYPLHLGVTEAGDGEDGRIKSAIGIGTLLEDGIGDTIRVSLTEDPEFEIPVCKALVKRYDNSNTTSHNIEKEFSITYNPFEYKRRHTKNILNIGDQYPPIVVSKLSPQDKYDTAYLESIGYIYNPQTDKWTIKDNAADYIWLEDYKRIEPFYPQNIKYILPFEQWNNNDKKQFSTFPCIEIKDLNQTEQFKEQQFFLFTKIDNIQEWDNIIHILKTHSQQIILLAEITQERSFLLWRYFFLYLYTQNIQTPVIIIKHNTTQQTIDDQLIHFSIETGALFTDGFGDGLCLYHSNNTQAFNSFSTHGRNYVDNKNIYAFLNNTAFTILQATRTRISKTEYISCPSCGRTLFDLQTTTAKIRQATHHLKGLKIGIMGCIVNGPGEMADADYGYVGSGEDKITLYRGKEIVKKNITTKDALNELIDIIKNDGKWLEP